VGEQKSEAQLPEGRRRNVKKKREKRETRPNTPRITGGQKPVEMNTKAPAQTFPREKKDGESVRKNDRERPKGKNKSPVK